MSTYNRATLFLQLSSEKMKNDVASLDAQHSLIQRTLADEAQKPKAPPVPKPSQPKLAPPVDISSVVDALAKADTD